jgi:hypothetical protein
MYKLALKRAQCRWEAQLWHADLRVDGCIPIRQHLSKLGHLLKEGSVLWRALCLFNSRNNVVEHARRCCGHGLPLLEVYLQYVPRRRARRRQERHAALRKHDLQGKCSIISSIVERSWRQAILVCQRFETPLLYCRQ